MPSPSGQNFGPVLDTLPEKPGAEIAHRIATLDATAYTVPTERPESDGTFEWDSTTIVIVEISSGDVTGIGYTY